METKLVVNQLRRNGCICEVLKINENRKMRSAEYVDVQDGLDYLQKIVRFAIRGYRFHMHLNGESPKGYILAFLALLVGRISCRPGLLTFHGGFPQTYFPRSRFTLIGFAFKMLFHCARGIRCDSNEIKRAIEGYGITPVKVTAISAFSSQYLNFSHSELAEETKEFLASHHPVFFCYVSFRPEYRLEVLREAMKLVRISLPQAGFIWLGFPDREVPPAGDWVHSWAQEEQKSLLLLGNLDHDTFLTLLQRCFAYIRTPACDGVSASVLEALAMGVPIVASENGRRPPGVLTYQQDDAAELRSKLLEIVKQYEQAPRVPTGISSEDNVQRIVDWLLSQAGFGTRQSSSPKYA
jgi:glycosyltransferase involved in cell wall biosynthesis